MPSALLINMGSRISIYSLTDHEEPSNDYIIKLLNKTGIHVRIDNQLKIKAYQDQLLWYNTLLRNKNHELNMAMKGLAVVAIIKSSLRAQDTVSRWGGEEFLILLPTTPPEGAVIKMELLRQILAKG